MLDALPVLAGTALLVASIRWPRRVVPRLLAVAAGVAALVGIWRATNGDGDLSDAGTALVLATVLAAVAAWFERDDGLGPAALALGGAAATAAGLARLEADTGGFVLPTARSLEPGPGWLLALGATAIVVAAGRRPRRAQSALLPAGLWLGIAAGGALEHGGDAIALVLGVGALLAPAPHAALALWSLAAAAVPVDGHGAAALLAAAAVVATTSLHPRAVVVAAPGAAALAIALADHGTPARVALAVLALATVARLWPTADGDDADVELGERVHPATAVAGAVGAWLLLAPETHTWAGDARLTGWGAGVLLAALAAGVAGYVALSVRGQDVELPRIEVADPSYRPGDTAAAKRWVVVALGILGIASGWLLASSLQ